MRSRKTSTGCAPARSGRRQGAIRLTATWAAALALAWLAVPLARAGSSLLIEPAELQQALAGVRVVDVRPADDFAKGHVPGAVHVAPGALDDAAANKAGLPVPEERAAALFRQLGIDEDTAIVAYDDHGGRFAARFFYVAEFFGHARVRVLNGGWQAWLAAGGGRETEARTPPPGSFRPRIDPDRIATAEWIQQQLEQGQPLTLLDVRSPEEFSGERAPAGGRGGHIPGAVNLDWRDTTTANGQGRFKPRDELRRMLSERGVSFDRNTVAYCASGTRASQLYFLLRVLGHGKVRNYDGSFADWSARPDLPVEK